MSFHISRQTVLPVLGFFSTPDDTSHRSDQGVINEACNHYPGGLLVAFVGSSAALASPATVAYSSNPEPSSHQVGRVLVKPLPHPHLTLIHSLRATRLFVPTAFPRGLPVLLRVGLSGRSRIRSGYTHGSLLDITTSQRHRHIKVLAL
jgi:hypothetical protein